MIPDALAEFKLAAITNTLRRCSMFADMPGADLSAIAAMASLKCLDKGAYLFWEGAPAQGFFIVQKGAIKLHRLNMKGQEQVFHIVRPTESFAEETVLSDAGYPADASAAEDSRVLLVHKTQFLRLLKTHRELTFRLLRSVSQQVRSLMGLVDDLTLKDVKTRLASWLVHHCPHPESCHPQRIQLDVTMRVLASELGVTSETLSRTLARFRKDQLVRVEGRAVTLTCPMRLSTIVRSNLGLPPASATDPDLNEADEERIAEKLAPAA